MDLLNFDFERAKEAEHTAAFQRTEDEIKLDRIMRDHKWKVAIKANWIDRKEADFQC